MGKWFVTTVHLDEDGTILDTRCVGYFDEMDQAIYSVSNNDCDIHEFSYNWAVIEHCGPGLYPDALCEIWYQWIPKVKGYVLSGKPKALERTVHFGIG
jgi:hypothetical protein